MARDPAPSDSSLASALRTFRRPWPIMGAGLAFTVAGLALMQTSVVPLRVIFLGVGTLLAGIAVARRLQTASWEWEDRLESAGLLGVAAFVAMFGYMAMDESWDSGTLFYFVLIVVSLVGAFLVLLPRRGRRIAAVVLVLLHFGGILTAVTSVPPRNNPAPWLSMQLWTNFYRNYLFFAYLTNAYHFYSPDPGPATLLWFHVEYADGRARWVKIPNRHDSPVGLHHQRMLAAAESTMNPGFPLMNEQQVKAFEEKFHTKYELLPGIKHDLGEEINKRRRIAPNLVNFVDPNDGRPAPLYPIFDATGQFPQYAEPSDPSRRLISSFARHIAHTEPDPEDPRNPVKAVRVYRVTHNLITPRELYEGKNPLDPWTFLPVYMGKYDPEGHLLDGGKYDRDGNQLEAPDPFLFWGIPYGIRVPKRYPEAGTYVPTQDGPMLNWNWTPEQENAEPWKIIDFVEIHATQSDKFRKETKAK
ncbi:MAG TPA: hypothetical protein VE999_04345 [Gemmataceae bacterium]|nr:hypothetical protein [Gemmataceae bacterium]